jgi:putative Ca2+/H+ antiporter (TMEM165/GDT1 family)
VARATGVGKILGTRLPERAVRVGAAVAFVVFGLILIWQGLRG